MVVSLAAEEYFSAVRVTLASEWWQDFLINIFSFTYFFLDDVSIFSFYIHMFICLFICYVKIMLAKATKQNIEKEKPGNLYSLKK